MKYKEFVFHKKIDKIWLLIIKRCYFSLLVFGLTVFEQRFHTMENVGITFCLRKNRIVVEHQGFYEIKCSTCQILYTRETNRSVNFRNEEHMVTVG